MKIIEFFRILKLSALEGIYNENSGHIEGKYLYYIKGKRRVFVFTIINDVATHHVLLGDIDIFPFIDKFKKVSYKEFVKLLKTDNRYWDLVELSNKYNGGSRPLATYVKISENKVAIFVVNEKAMSFDIYEEPVEFVYEVVDDIPVVSPKAFIKKVKRYCK